MTVTDIAYRIERFLSHKLQICRIEFSYPIVRVIRSSISEIRSLMTSWVLQFTVKILNLDFTTATYIESVHVKITQKTAI